MNQNYTYIAHVQEKEKKKSKIKFPCTIGLQFTQRATVCRALQKPMQTQNAILQKCGHPLNEHS